MINIKKPYIFLTLIGLFSFALAYYAIPRPSISSESIAPAPTNVEKVEPTPAEDSLPSAIVARRYEGEVASIAGSFSVNVPNGWQASISENSSFLGVMFARPNKLESLLYDTKKPAAVDRNGIPSWNGLTEHFFIISPTPDRAFNPNRHLEVSSQPFTFDDGTIGQYYYVVKHAEEAMKFGGLQKDSEWQGRTYIYEKDGKKIEAHLALYPSTAVSISFFEDVVRSIQF